MVVFKDLIGQSNLVSTLRRMVLLNHLPKTLILSGTSGTGKTTLARVLCAFANCTNRGEFEPCNGCASCLNLDRGTIEVDGALHSGVEQIRKIVEISRYRPVQRRFRFFLIDEFHMLSHAAQSALLKTLEESDPSNKFILVTTNPERVQEGILTRSLSMHLKALNEVQIRDLCALHNPTMDEETMNEIIFRSAGLGRSVVSLSSLSRILKDGVSITRFMDGVPRDILRYFWRSLIELNRSVLKRFSVEIIEGYSSKELMLSSLINSLVKLYDEGFNLNKKERMLAVDSILATVRYGAHLTKSAAINFLIF